MFNPKYRLLITRESFPSDQFICLGSQMILIVNFLESILPMHTWYGADVDAAGKIVKQLDINGCQLNVIGSDEQLIEYCSKINQFIWGVFLCVDNRYCSPNIRNIELETEDEPFREIPYQGILVEIRLFDTSYFEIYAEDEKIIKKISNKFNYSKLVVRNN